MLQETRREASVIVEDEDGEEPALEARVLVARVLAKRWWVIGITALFTAGFCAAAFLLTPMYRATTVLAPATADRGGDVVGAAAGALGGLASGLGLGGPRDAETEEALAVFRSREFTERFILDENLMPKLFPRDWNSVTSAWKENEDHRPTLAKAFKKFDTKIRSVEQDRKTGLIVMQIEWKDRAEAASWANDLVGRVNEEMRRRAIVKADTSMQFLEKEVQTTSTVEVHEAISRLMEAQVKQRMLANVTHDYSFRVVDRAISSDGDEPVSPQKGFLAAAGVLTGLIFGIGCALILTSNGMRRDIRRTLEGSA